MAGKISKSQMEKLDLARELGCETDAKPESTVDTGLTTDSRSRIRTFIAHPSDIRVYESVQQLYAHYDSVEAPVDSINNPDSLEEYGNINLRSLARRRLLTRIGHHQNSEIQSGNCVDGFLARDHHHLRKVQVQLMSKLHHISKKKSLLQPHNLQEMAVVPGQSHVIVLDEKLSGTHTSQPHQEFGQWDAYVSLIAKLESVLKKLCGTRQETAEGAEDLWEIMRSGPNPYVDSLDRWILNFLWCHKNVFWQNDLVESLEILRKGINAEACQKYNLSLETVRGNSKVHLKVLEWLRSHPSLPWVTPENIILDGAIHWNETSTCPCDLGHYFQDYRGSISNAGVTSGAIDKRNCAGVGEVFPIDGPFDTRSPEVAAKASRFYLKKEALESDAASSLIVESMKLISSGIAADGDRGWDSIGLLQVTDRIRGECKNTPLSSSDLALVDCILRDILKREPYEGVSITYSNIMFSRLDKLLDLISGMEERDLPTAKNLQQVKDLISLVELSWHRRFAGRVPTIDQDRVRILLDKVLFERSSKLGHLRLISEAKSRIPIEEIQLELGKWWPNFACVCHDSFLNGVSTDRSFAIPTIPLLNGIEIHDKAAECLQYKLEGRLHDLKLSLQTKVGKTIRLLRGYKLKSLLAPEVGIRYDGKYYLSRYGHEYADPTKGIFRMTLWYHRVSDQPVLSSDALLYKPSIKDDWELYKKVEDEEMQKRCNALDYASWRAQDEREVMECKTWRSEQAAKEQNEGEKYPRRLILKK